MFVFRQLLHAKHTSQASKETSPSTANCGSTGSKAWISVQHLFAQPLHGAVGITSAEQRCSAFAMVSMGSTVLQATVFMNVASATAPLRHEAPGDRLSKLKWNTHNMLVLAITVQPERSATPSSITNRHIQTCSILAPLMQPVQIQLCRTVFCKLARTLRSTTWLCPTNKCSRPWQQASPGIALADTLGIATGDQRPRWLLGAQLH